MVNVCFRVSSVFLFSRQLLYAFLLYSPPPTKSPKRDLETFNSFYHFCISKGEDWNSNRICLRWTHNSPDLPCTQDSLLASVWTDEELQPLPGTCTELLISQLAMSASPLGFSYFSNGLMLHRCSFFFPSCFEGSRLWMSCQSTIWVKTGKCFYSFLCALKPLSCRSSIILDFLNQAWAFSTSWFLRKSLKLLLEITSMGWHASNRKSCRLRAGSSSLENSVTKPCLTSFLFEFK